MDILSLRQDLQSSIFNHSETPHLDAQVLLAHICRKERGWILAHPEAELTAAQHNALNKAVSELETGKPLPYIIGHWAFYGLDFDINTNTLIPRPETELMVEQAIEWLEYYPGQRGAVDIGTGSGCIAVSLAVHITDLQVTGTDISMAALEMARSNAHKHGVADRVNFKYADLLSFDTSTSPFHLICANLPYIPRTTLEGLEVFGREPTLALDGGPNGLRLIHKLLPQAAQKLNSPGLLLLEIEASQGKTCVDLARARFPNARINLLSDLAGHDRLIRIEIL